MAPGQPRSKEPASAACWNSASDAPPLSAYPTTGDELPRCLMPAAFKMNRETSWVECGGRRETTTVWTVTDTRSGLQRVVTRVAVTQNGQPKGELQWSEKWSGQEARSKRQGASASSSAAAAAARLRPPTGPEGGASRDRRRHSDASTHNKLRPVGGVRKAAQELAHTRLDASAGAARAPRRHSAVVPTLAAKGALPPALASLKEAPAAKVVPSCAAAAAGRGNVSPYAEAIASDPAWAAVKAHATSSRVHGIGRKGDAAALARALSDGPARGNPDLCAWAAFCYVTEFVAYDTVSFFGGARADCSSGGVLRGEMGVCSGYARLFASLCEHMGLECVGVSGAGKGIGHRPGEPVGHSNHEWNKVRLSVGEVLVDCCWGAGHVNGTKFVRKFEPDYFAVPPENLITTHLPECDAHQLLHPPMSREAFSAQARPWPLFFRCGMRAVGSNGSVVPAAVLTLTGTSGEFSLQSDPDVWLMASLGGKDLGVERAMQDDGRAVHTISIEGAPRRGRDGTVGARLLVFARKGDRYGGTYHSSLELAVNSCW